LEEFGRRRAAQALAPRVDADFRDKGRLAAERKSALKEGTRSYLIGSHQFLLHPLWVLFAWRLEYKGWPKWWEIICIFLHDVGVCGRQYLSDDGAKKGHWMLGAWWSYLIVWKLSRNPYLGQVAAWTCAGHCPGESSLPHLPVHESKLFRADKRSWLIAPMWWLWSNYWIEDFSITTPRTWRRLVEENLREPKMKSSHALFLSVKNGVSDGQDG